MSAKYGELLNRIEAKIKDQAANEERLIDFIRTLYDSLKARMDIPPEFCTWGTYDQGSNFSALQVRRESGQVECIIKVAFPVDGKTAFSHEIPIKVKVDGSVILVDIESSVTIQKVEFRPRLHPAQLTEVVDRLESSIYTAVQGFAS